MRRRTLLAVAVLAACPGSKHTGQAPIVDQHAGGERDERADLIAELQDDILKSYERDDPPEHENGMLVPSVGPARLGVGPGDVLLASELQRAPSRWPLDLERTARAEARSKRLEIRLAADRTAAWVSDDISWRIKLCGRTAVIPLRLTALYARDGDRWVPVFEHLAFARTPTPTRPGQKQPRQIFTAVASRDLADELSRVLSPVLRRTLDKSPQVIATGPEAALFGADLAAEWHGTDVTQARLLPGAAAMKLEDRRVGLVGRLPAKATIAYWIGNLTAELPARPGVAAGKGHFRATFVFEHRNDRWVIVQGHLSHAIEDAELANTIFGTALIAAKPLAIECDGALKAPVVAPKAPGRAEGTR